MSDKKLNAKKLMLQKLSKDLRDTSNKSIGDELKSKKKPAPEMKELPKEKALSKAEQLLKAKYGEMGLSDDSMEDAEEDSEESEDEHEHCPACEDKGCAECEETEEA